MRRVRRVVGAAGEQRADLVVDQHLLLARRVGIVPAVVATRCARIGDGRDELLIHLPDLLGQRHAAQQIRYAMRYRRLGIEIGGRRRGSLTARRDADQGGGEQHGGTGPDQDLPTVTISTVALRPRHGSAS
jgi:hypothetical protein